jgi:uncharacterized protein YodC (DUF2158 family)
MDDRKFKVGDVVRLNAGGPKMTVEGFDESVVVCIWFTEDHGMLRNGRFVKAALTLVEDK